MSSFYGNSGYNSGGSGVTDYNELSNKPIINRVGTQENPIVFSGLGYGEYCITGYYKQDDLDDLHNTENAVQVAILKDQQTHFKVIKYQTVELGVIFVHTIAYGSNGIVSSHTKFPMKGTDDGSMDYSNYIFWGESF